MAESTPLPRRNHWSRASLIAGAISILFSFIAYVPFIPAVSLLSFPLGFCAMVAGFVGERQAKQAADRAAAAQARWGFRFGCLAWLIEISAGVLTAMVVAGLLAAAIAAMINAQTKP